MNHAVLYIHIPFCRSKCAYCDFYSAPGRGADISRYVDALISEWNLRRSEIDGLELKTAYIGGGTPSLIPHHELQRLIRGIGLDNKTLAEFSIEANPEDITPDTIKRWRDMGINRVSIGVQSFDDDSLAAIGRNHRAADSLKALEILKASGINFNGDLIYGLPGQSLDQWKEELEGILSFSVPHLSAYLLSYEPGTRLYAQMISGKVHETSDQLAIDMYEYLCQRSAQAGYCHYEISNFAQPGAKAIHNSSYWDYTPYLGIGAAAHSFTRGSRKWNPANIKQYCTKLLAPAPQPAIVEDEESETACLNDYIITSLRTADGFNRLFASRKFSPLVLDAFYDNVARVDSSRLSVEAERIYIPERHWLMADSILRDLIV